MNNDKRFYSKDRLFSYRAFLNISLGARGTGKTTCAKFWCIDDFLKTKKRFVWVRRYNTELSGDKRKGIEGCIKSFTKKIEKFYPKTKFEIKKNHLFINEKDAGCFVALSTSTAMKSVDFENVNKIIFDEFLIMDGSKYSYLRNEMTLFLDLISTVFRPIADENEKEQYRTRVWLLSNAITFGNDYFFYFNIKPFPINSIYYDKKRGIAVEQYENKIHEKAVKDTMFGKLVDGTEYSKYAIENNYLLDNSDFLGKKSNNATLMFNIRYDGREWGVYSDDEYVYITNGVDKSRPFFTFTKQDHSIDSILVKSCRGTRFETLIRAYQFGIVKFENIMIKRKFIDFMSLFIVK